MEKYDVKFKKRLGQNFLKNTSVVKRIVDVVSDKDNSLVIEVGPGGGILTRELCSSFNNVLAYEIDESLKEELSKRVSEFDNINILYKDFMKADIASDVSTYSVDKRYFISNVPYYITSPIILKLIDSNIMFDKIVMMVQKEVGERYSAAPGTKNYGAISVILQYFYDIKKEFVVSKNNFVPVPKVDSVIISFTPRIPKIKVDDINKFRKVVNDSFRFKRKTIKNNLSDYDLITVEKILNKYGYNLSSRAEEIPVEAFCEISMNI